VVDATRPPDDVATAINTAADRLVRSDEPKQFAVRTNS
jgi:hypothetical protein